MKLTASRTPRCDRSRAGGLPRPPPAAARPRGRQGGAGIDENSGPAHLDIRRHRPHPCDSAASGTTFIRPPYAPAPRDQSRTLSTGRGRRGRPADAAAGAVGVGDSFLHASGGRRAPGWSPADAGRRTHAAWSSRPRLHRRRVRRLNCAAGRSDRRQMQRPPSTSTQVPRIIAASSEARNTAVRAKSSWLVESPERHGRRSWRALLIHHRPLTHERGEHGRLGRHRRDGDDSNAVARDFQREALGRVTTAPFEAA